MFTFYEINLIVVSPLVLLLMDAGQSLCDLDTKLSSLFDEIPLLKRSEPMGKGAKQMVKPILTLAELEFLAGLGLTGLLALHGAGVAGHEAFLAQG